MGAPTLANGRVLSKACLARHGWYGCAIGSVLPRRQSKVLQNSCWQSNQFPRCQQHRSRLGAQTVCIINNQRGIRTWQKALANFGWQASFQRAVSLKERALESIWMLIRTGQLRMLCLLCGATSLSGARIDETFHGKYSLPLLKPGTTNRKPS